MSNEIALMREIARLEEKINALRTIEIGGVWTTYTPTWTAATTNPTIGNGTLTGRYVVIGKVCHAMVYVLAGTTTNAGSGAYSFTYPIAPAYDYLVGGAWMERNTGGNLYSGGIYGFSSTFALVYSGASYVTNATPFGFANQDFLRIFLTYEI